MKNIYNTPIVGEANLKLCKAVVEPYETRGNQCHCDKGPAEGHYHQCKHHPQWYRDEYCSSHKKKLARETNA